MALAVHANAAELQQLSSFYRLLNQASASRSERELMRVFVEALAVWQDAESWAYVADVTGRFVLDVSLPGSDRTRVPAVIDPARLTGDLPAASRITLESLEALGFGGHPNLLLSRIEARGASDWIIITENPGDADAEARLAVYAQAVVQSLNEVNAIHSSRLTWAMLEHLLPAGDSLAQAAHQAISELATSVDATAWLTVYTDEGQPVLTAGDLMSVLSRPSPTRSPHVLVLPVDVAAPCHAAVGVRRSGDRALTGRDEQLLRLAASTFGTWLSTAVDRLATDLERRVGPRSFDHVLKRRIDEALVRNEAISVIVISLAHGLERADAAHECVAGIRRQLRPADMAGRLSSGEIGVVLPETSSRDARPVIERLRLLLASDIPPGPLGASISLARLPVNGADRSAGAPLHEFDR